MATSEKKPMNPLTVVLGLSAIFFLIFLIISGAVYMMQWRGVGGSGTGRMGPIFGDGYVGVVEVNGVILDSKKTVKRLQDFEDDPRIKGVVIRLNSPGGSVGPSQEIYEVVRKYKKPVVASMASVAASGAYYIAVGTKKIYSNPGTITGSIGVIMEFANLERLYEWAKIQRYALKTGKFKGVGAEYREMTDEERRLLQSMLDDVLEQFKTAVSTGRKLTMEQVAQVADGRIFSGNQAKKAKLVDELGTLDDAIQEVGKMAGIKGEPKVVYPERARPRWLEFVLDNGGADEDDSGARTGLIQRLLTGEVARILGVPVTPGEAALAPGIYWLWKGAY